MTDKNYEASGEFSRDEALKAFESENHEIILDALLGIINGVDDHEWVVTQLLEYVRHPDKWAAGAAIGGLGDVARIYKKIDKKTVLPVLEELKDHEEVAGKVEDALGDIEMFAKD